MTTLTPAAIRHACTVLSAPGLIRLVTEIDDNGPIPPRSLTRTLPDLPVPQLRHSVEQARALRLVHNRPGVGLTLTPSGSGLADVYDAMARWARHHCLPAPVYDFTSRVQHALSLYAVPTALTSQEGREGAPVIETGEKHASPGDLLTQWLYENPQFVQGAEPVLAA